MMFPLSIPALAAAPTDVTLRAAPVGVTAVCDVAIFLAVSSMQPWWEASVAS
jgi:hypothetical protein